MPTSTDHIADVVVLFISAAALGIGLLSSLLGWLSKRLVQQPRRSPRHGVPAHQDTMLASAADPAAPLTTTAWLQRLNHQPDQVPHLLIVGPTGSGKTTLAVALLADRPGQIVALTPKLKPDDWRGLAPISLAADGSYTPLVNAIATLEAERKRRCVALAAGITLAPLTVVLDELPDLVDEVSGTGDLLRKLSQMGRDLRMRVIALATSELVEDLGLKGRGHARRNFATLRLDPPQAGQPRIGTLQWGSTAQRLALGEVAQRAARAQLSHQQWKLPLLAGQLSSVLPMQLSTRGGGLSQTTQGVPAVAVIELPSRARQTGAELFQAPETHFSASESESAPSNPHFSDLEIAQIAAQIALGEKKSKVVQAMPRYSGPKYASYAAYYERLRIAIEGAEKI